MGCSFDNGFSNGFGDIFQSNDDLAALRLRVRRKADMVNTQYVLDAEIDEWLNEGGIALHDILTTKYEDYFLCSKVVPLVSGVSFYDLPDNLYKLRGVDYITGGNSYTLRRFNFEERNIYSSRGTFGGFINVFGLWLSYRLEGRQIHFIPIPTSGEFRIWYIPKYQKLEESTESLDQIYVSGAEEYIVMYAAIQALMKEESNVTMQMTQLQQIQRRLESSFGARDAGDPIQMTDHRGYDDLFYWGRTNRYGYR